MADVYAITNKDTGEQYIGSCRIFARRRSRHLSDLRHGRHHNKELQATFDMFGADRLTFTLLESAPGGDICDCEQRWIDRLSPVYNALSAKRGERGGGKRDRSSRIEVYFPKDVHEQIRMRAETEHTTMSAIIINAVMFASLFEQGA